MTGYSWRICLGRGVYVLLIAPRFDDRSSSLVRDFLGGSETQNLRTDVPVATPGQPY
jgi:hypothetical protein